MMIENLHQLDDHLQLLHFFQEDNQLIFVLKRDTQSTKCHHCRHLSHCPHSSYTRIIHDLPIGNQIADKGTVLAFSNARTVPLFALPTYSQMASLYPTHLLFVLHVPFLP